MVILSKWCLPWGRFVLLTAKGPGSLWSLVKVLYVNLNDGYIGVCIYIYIGVCIYVENWAVYLRLVCFTYLLNTIYACVKK